MASVVAGAALKELLPQAVLIGGGENEVGFFYDFILEDSPIPELATLVKEKMRGIYLNAPPFKEMEMVAFSASQLLQKKNHLGALEMLEEINPKALVSVVQLGDFVDLADGPFQYGPRVYLDFFHVEAIDEEVYRLQGCIDLNQETLKAHVKKIQRYQKQNYRTEGEKKNFWSIVRNNFIS